MTLLEALLAIVVVAVVASVLAPLIGAVSDSYAVAAQTRSQLGRAAFAIDRCVRLLREPPAGASAGSVGIVRAEEQAVEFDDGKGLELSGTDLLLLDPAGSSVLCRDVTDFQIEYFGADGMTDTRKDPESTRRFFISLTTGDAELRSTAFPRSAVAR